MSWVDDIVNNLTLYDLTSGWIPCAAMLAGVGTYVRRHNCHVKGCWRLQWHVHPEHGHPVCKRHHPEEVHADR